MFTQLTTIRNVVLLGHGGCGKTSLVEAMAYLSGMTSRLGKVSDGNTISDYGQRGDQPYPVFHQHLSDTDHLGRY